ncbi:hypothetical protein C0989_004853, partial [Termitomyces sp. Mn162]
VVHGGGGGFPGGPKADQVSSHVAKGGEHGAVCGEGGVFAGWSGKGGVLGSDSWEALRLPILGSRTQQEAVWAGPPESLLFSPTPGIPLERSLSPPAPIPSITEIFLCKQVEALTMLLAAQEGELRWAREDHDMAQTEKEAME